MANKSATSLFMVAVSQDNASIHTRDRTPPTEDSSLPLMDPVGGRLDAPSVMVCGHQHELADPITRFIRLVGVAQVVS